MLCVVLWGLSGLAGANPNAAALPDEPFLLPSPDLQRLEPSVRERLAAARTHTERQLRQPDLSPREEAGLLGQLGRLYHAHYIADAALACYRGAQRLDSGDFRWWYLAGVGYQQKSALDSAVEVLRRALQIRPGDAPAQYRLAEVFLELNRLDRAEILFEGLRDRPGMEAGALAGLGRIALARRDYQAAATDFEKALEHQPRARSLYYPLAMAYRGMRDVTRARDYLSREGGQAPQFPDPLVEEVTDLSSGVRTHIRRATKAMDARAFAEAIDELEAALAIEPGHVSARLALARALYDSGDRGRARVEVGQVLAAHPDHVLANFFMGLLNEDAGQTGPAMHRFRHVLDLDPEHPGAHFHLANGLATAGRHAEAAEHYARVVRTVPENRAAWILEALASARAGAPDAEIRARLEAGARAYPDDPMFAYLLVRLLAASPDAEVRDGERAVLLGETVYARFPLVENGEALAMAYAETGRYDTAVRIQEEVLNYATLLGRVDLLTRLDGERSHYREGRPWRVPWPDRDYLIERYVQHATAEP